MEKSIEILEENWLIKNTLYNLRFLLVHHTLIIFNGLFELRPIEYFCYASHLLFVESNDSISDAIRINDVCNEVKVTHQNSVRSTEQLHDVFEYEK